MNSRLDIIQIWDDFKACEVEIYLTEWGLEKFH